MEVATVLNGYGDIKTQILDYCECTKDSPQLDKNIQLLLTSLSQYLCWNRYGCETFLFQERYDRFNLDTSRVFVDKCSCVTCSNGIEKVALSQVLRSVPVEIDEVQVIVLNRLTSNAITLQPNEYLYREQEKLLYLDILSLRESSLITDCSKLEISVKYHSGFTVLPECILQVICDLLQIVQEKQSCDCGSCKSCSERYDDENPLDFENSEDDSYTKNLANLIETSLLATLNRYSLCDNSRFIGIVSPDCADIGLIGVVI